MGLDKVELTRKHADVLLEKCGKKRVRENWGAWCERDEGAVRPN
jgi:hypothetical protein